MKRLIQLTVTTILVFGSHLAVAQTLALKEIVKQPLSTNLAIANVDSASSTNLKPTIQTSKITELSIQPATAFDPSTVTGRNIPNYTVESTETNSAELSDFRENQLNGKTSLIADQNNTLDLNSLRDRFKIPGVALNPQGPGLHEEIDPDQIDDLMPEPPQSGSEDFRIKPRKPRCREDGFKPRLSQCRLSDGAKRAIECRSQDGTTKLTVGTKVTAFAVSKDRDALYYGTEEDGVFALSGTRLTKTRLADFETVGTPLKLSVTNTDKTLHVLDTDGFGMGIDLDNGDVVENEEATAENAEVAEDKPSMNLWLCSGRRLNERRVDDKTAADGNTLEDEVEEVVVVDNAPVADLSDDMVAIADESGVVTDAVVEFDETAVDPSAAETTGASEADSGAVVMDGGSCSLNGGQANQSGSMGFLLTLLTLIIPLAVLRRRCRV